MFTERYSTSSPIARDKPEYFMVTFRAEVAEAATTKIQQENLASDWNAAAVGSRSPRDARVSIPVIHCGYTYTCTDIHTQWTYIYMYKHNTTTNF